MVLVLLTFRCFRRQAGLFMLQVMIQIRLDEERAVNLSGHKLERASVYDTKPSEEQERTTVICRKRFQEQNIKTVEPGSR